MDPLGSRETAEEITLLKQQIDRLSTDVHKSDIQGMRPTEAFKWTTERLVHAERLRRLLKNLDPKASSTEQRSLLKSMHVRLEDVMNLLKNYEKRRPTARESGLVKSLIGRGYDNGLGLAKTPSIERYGDEGKFLSSTSLLKSGQSSSALRGTVKKLDRLNMQELEKRNKQLEGKVNELNTVLTDYGDKIKEIQQQIKNKDSLVNEYKKANQKLKAEYDSLLRLNERLRTEMKPSRMTPRYALNATIDESAAAVPPDNKFKQKINDMNSKIAYLTQELTKEKNRSKMLIGELDKFKNSEDSLIEKTKDQEADLKNAVKEIELREEKIKKLAEVQESLDKNYKDLNLNHSKLKEKSSQERKKLNKYKAKVTEQADEIKTLKERLGILEQEMNDALAIQEMQIQATFQQRIDQLEELLNEYEGQNKSLKATLQSVNEEFGKYKTKYNVNAVSDLEKAIKQKDEYICNLKEDLDKASNAAMEYERWLNTAENQREQLANENAILTAQKEEDSKRYMETINDQVEKIKNLQNELEKERDELADIYEGKGGEVAELEKTVESLEKEKGELIVELNMVKEEVAGLKEKNEKLELEAETHKQSLETLEAENKKLEAKKDKSVERLKGLLKKYEGINQDLLTNLKIKESSISTWKGYTKQLQEQIHSLQRELQVQETNLSFGEIATQNNLSDKTFELAQKIDTMKNEVERDIQTSLKELEALAKASPSQSESLPELPRSLTQDFEDLAAIRITDSRSTEYPPSDSYRIKAENNSMKLQVELLKKQIETLETQRSELVEKSEVEYKETFAKLKQKYEQVNEKLKKCEADLKGRDAALKELKETLQQKEKAIHQLRIQLLSHHKEIEEKDNDTDETFMKNEAGFAEEELEDYKKVILSLREEKELLESQLEEMKENVRKVLEEREEQNELCEQKIGEVSYLHKLLDDSDKLIQELRTQLSNSTKELQTVSEENAKLQKQLQKVQGTVDALKEKLRGTQQENNKMEEEMGKLSNELNDVMESMAEVKIENEQYKSQINNLMQRLELAEKVTTAHNK